MSAIADPPLARPGLAAEVFARQYAGERVELIRGQVREVPMPFPKHGKICGLMAYFLTDYAIRHDHGHVMTNDSFVKTASDTVRGGDVLYYTYERLPRGPVPEGILPVAPDLVAEVRSPSETWMELFAKILEYLQAGVRAVVVLDAGSATASVYRNGPVLQQIFRIGDELAIPEVLPGFSVPVARLLDA